MKLGELRRMLEVHEGRRRKPYVDTTGHVTIGVGRNLTSVGLSEHEVDQLLHTDIVTAVRVVRQFVPTFMELSTARQHALIDMAFNLGAARFAEFHQMLSALQRRDYASAAEEMLASKWATQVGERATTLAEMMREGKDNE